MPRLLSRPALLKLFTASTTKRPAELFFPQFVDALGRVGIAICSEPPYAALYSTPAKKLEALFGHMEIGDDAAFAEHLAVFDRTARVPAQDQSDGMWSDGDRR